MRGLSAAVQLSQRAVENGSFIESVCLAASVIDAQLRIGLILNHQLKTKSNDLIDELLCQIDDNKIVTERNIYKRALKENIIPQKIYEELNDLYHKRNKVVHQYIISDITTEEIVKIAAKYADTVHIIKDSIRNLENEQIRLGIGMTVSGNRVPDSIRGKANEVMDKQSDEKHGNSNLAKIFRRKSAT
ncbi:MAG: hypothetical protein A2Z82_04135 [Nitrospirae bacterium GWA2_46_11]|nr:MAG: hypothetical protein A2Z82_04135 [Nitrospirae bacterium GWA2_46_11]